MSNVLISVRDLSVAYEGTTALDEVSLDIFEDDFLGVIGPNGGGKTSLVRAILGNIPYRGTVNYAAELFRGKERLIGYLPQQNVFDRAFPISVTETVLSGLQGHKRFRSRYTAEDRRRALELLERTGIAEVAGRAIGEISGGQMQRVAVARAFVTCPGIIFADEPTGNLDCDTAYEIMQIFLELKEKNGQSTILVTHDPTIASYADRVLFLQDGRFYGEYEKKSGTGNVDEILVEFRKSQKIAGTKKNQKSV